MCKWLTKKNLIKAVEVIIVVASYIIKHGKPILADMKGAAAAF